MFAKSPIRRNMFASLFGVGVNLLNQIVLVPFYILFWGNDLYSDWIVLSSMTAFFSMSDAGLNNVIQNRFAIKYAEGNYEECNSLLSCNVFIISVTFVVFLLVTSLYLLLANISDHMSLHVLNKQEASLIFILLLAKVFLSMYSGVQNAIYRATHHADRAIFLDQIMLLAVVAITFLFVVIKGSIVLLCVSICIPPILLIVFKHIDSLRYFDHHISYLHFNWSLVKKMLIPSLSFMSFPGGYAIILQGFTLVVNNFFGSSEVVLYNTSRTMCNFIKALLNIIQNSVWPEYSIAYGNGDYNRMRILHRKSILISVSLSIFVAICLMLFGPLIFIIWTHGKILFDYPLMIGFIAALIIESLWASSSITVIATNNHTKLGLIFLLTASLSIVLAIIILTICKELPLITLPLIFLQIVMCVFAIKESLKLTKDKLSNVFLYK